jgi:hypothetical protein
MAHGIFGVMRVPPADAAPGAEGRDPLDLPAGGPYLRARPGHRFLVLRQL